MKTSIYILLFCFSVIIIINAEQKLINQISIDTQTKFGRQSSDCRGRGLCSFTTKDISESQTNSNLIYTADKLTLSIYRDKITIEDEIKIIGYVLTKNSKTDSLTFIIHDDFELNGIDQTIPQTEPVASIPKGSYPIRVTESTFILTFNLE